VDSEEGTKLESILPFLISLLNMGWSSIKNLDLFAQYIEKKLARKDYRSTIPLSTATYTYKVWIPYF
jgi:hypothetical protein